MPRYRALVPALLLLAATAGPRSVQAAWPNDPGLSIRIAPSPFHQLYFSMAPDGAGGAFVVWGEQTDLRAQHLTAQGLVAPGWPAGGITVCAAGGAQYASDAVADGEGGFIVVWNDYRSGSADIFAQRISAGGTPLWTPDGVAVCGTLGDQFNGRVCSDRAGGGIFVWQDARDFGVADYDVYAQRVLANGTTAWSTGGTPICTATGRQEEARAVSDGTVGGAFFAWSDQRSGTGDLYASHLDGNGVLKSGWTTYGDLLCGAAGVQSLPSMIADGAFGAIVAWVDQRSGSTEIFAKRMHASGPTAPGWAADGVALTSGGGVFRWWPKLVTDGAGGALVTWEDLRSGVSDVYAQRVGSGGTVTWAANGVALSLAPGDQYFAHPVSDGAGGAVVAFQDQRAGWPPMIFAQHVTGAGTLDAAYDANGKAIATGSWVQELVGCSDGAGGAIFAWQDNANPQAGRAQRIDRWGYLGAQPTIASVADVPNDQGGRVKLSWDRSPLDAWPEEAIDSYLVYRSVPPQLALAALAGGDATLEGDATNLASSPTPRRTFATSQLAGTTYYWEQIGTVPAGQLAGYSTLAATAQDSVAGSNPMTLFMVRAQDTAGARFWLSDPDSGYSTDDLAPAAPTPFAAAYASGATELHWGRNTEADLAGYRLYRGSAADFVPGPGNLVAAQPDTGFSDPGPAGSYYKLTAVDAHGNESPVSLVGPSGTVAAPAPGMPLAFSIAAPAPNPSSGTTACRFSLPREGFVRVSIHDVAGRLVRVLAEERLPAGEHVARWDGTTGAGTRVSGGLYFERVTFEGSTRTAKILRAE